jgi:predicted amidophosphoribosyltransferase
MQTSKIENSCPICGATIKPKYKICIKCNGEKKAAKTAHCNQCGKPIEPKYEKCFSCHNLQKPALPYLHFK